MATYNKYDIMVKNLVDGVMKFATGAPDTFKTMLSNTAPNVATHAVRADVTELATSGGYTSGGITNTITTSTSGTNPATAKVTSSNDPLWTGSGGGFTFRYAILYDDTPTSPADPLIAYWDYGSPQLVNAGETLTVDYDQAAGVFTVT